MEQPETLYGTSCTATTKQFATGDVVQVLSTRLQQIDQSESPSGEKARLMGSLVDSLAAGVQRRRSGQTTRDVAIGVDRTPKGKEEEMTRMPTLLEYHDQPTVWERVRLLLAALQRGDDAEDIGVDPDHLVASNHLRQRHRTSVNGFPEWHSRSILLSNDPGLRVDWSATVFADLSKPQFALVFRNAA